MSNSKLQVSILNFKEICRTCSCRGDMIPIFGEGDHEKEIVKMLETVTNYKPTKEDNLPQQICTKCYSQLLVASAFKNKCIKVLAKLKSLADSEFMPVVIESIVPMDEDDEGSQAGSLLGSVKQETLSEVEGTEYYDYVVAEEEDENVDIKYQALEVLDSESVKEGTVIQILSPSQYEYVEEDQEEIVVPETEGEAHLCHKCNKFFINIQQLKRHIRSKHSDIVSVNPKNEDGTYSCTKCDERFTDLVQCQDHEIEHVLQSHVEVGENGELIHICAICYRTFPSKHGLSIHQAFHTNRKLDVEIDKPYECQICDKSFVSMKAMRNHKKTHGSKTYSCLSCNKTFTIKARYQIHMRTHTGEKPYSCHDCGKCFSNTTSLRIHDLIHSGARPHNCNLCNRGFKQHSHLKNHMLTHSGSRPFDCPICGKTFVFKGNLTVHMRMHSGETPYVCSVCGKGFYDSSRMKKHRKTHDKQIANHN